MRGYDAGQDPALRLTNAREAGPRKWHCNGEEMHCMHSSRRLLVKMCNVDRTVLGLARTAPEALAGAES